MKKGLWIILFLVGLFCFSPLAHANYLQAPADPVVFWAVDDPIGEDNAVTITISNVFPYTNAGLTIQWSTDNATWNDLTGQHAYNFTVQTGSDGRELVYLRLADASGPVDAVADLDFLGQGTTISDLYDGIDVFWNGITDTSLTALNIDNVTPNCDKVQPVPIPAAMLLFGSGLLGLLGVGRRAKA